MYARKCEDRKPCCCSCDRLNEILHSWLLLLMSLFTEFDSVQQYSFFLCVKYSRAHVPSCTHHSWIRFYFFFFSPACFVVIFEKGVFCRYFDCVFMLLCSTRMVYTRSHSIALCFPYSIRFKILIEFKTLNRINAFA